jgi:nucleotide-binding universal stress UspA family protein
MERETAMNEKMKLLIAYDGSDCSKEALKDLQRAGLPREAQAVVVTVADVPWLPPPPPSSYEIVESVFVRHIHAKAEIAYEEALRPVEETHELAAEASARMRSNFPTWEVRAEALTGTGIKTASELIRRADQWKADLIVVGSHGRSALGRLLLGSVSQQVVTEAPCSVRVARYPVEKDDSPICLIIGVDGSPSARTAVGALARRRWPAGSKARVIAVDDHVRPTGIAHLLPTATTMIAETINEELAKKQEMVEAAVEDLRAVAGLHVSSEIIEGDPKSVLIEEAKKFEADCIFVGSRGLNSRLPRFMLGSVSTAVVNGAHCSVEVVREMDAGR